MCQILRPNFCYVLDLLVEGDRCSKSRAVDGARYRLGADHPVASPSPFPTYWWLRMRRRGGRGAPPARWTISQILPRVRGAPSAAKAPFSAPFLLITSSAPRSCLVLAPRSAPLNSPFFCPQIGKQSARKQNLAACLGAGQNWDGYSTCLLLGLLGRSCARMDVGWECLRRSQNY